MNDRGRRAVILLPILVTLLLTALVGMLVVVQNQRQADRVSRAEAVAQDYLSDVATFRSSVVEKITDVKDADPGRLKMVVDSAVDEPPKLPDASDYGMANSTAYDRAARVESKLLDPYRRLSTTLDKADTSFVFIAAARDILDLRAVDYIGYGSISSSGPVRSSFIPAFIEARDAFDRTDVPKGQQELATTVRDAVQYVIDQATVLADRLDGRQNYSFDYTEEFAEAEKAVDDYAATVNGDVGEAINAVTAEP